MICKNCYFFRQQSGSCHGSCKNSKLKREDLEFVTEDAIRLFMRLDFPPEIIKSCKKHREVIKSGCTKTENCNGDL